ncbi:alpha/beta hydrolase [Gemella cuniculi]|uniref:alpha/beta hydrolase n=1 Tax=Gemella cuniculi TaxID=150240 RepID=UPI0003F79A60|nr:alpha/beta fold hydrolase [Gemella cuniculi]
MKKHLKKILVSVLVFLVIAFGLVGNYFYNFALNPKVDKSAIVNQDSDGEKEDKKVLESWFENNKEEVTMDSVTKNKLVGYKFENSQSDKWIVVVHGYTSSAKKMVNYIKKFHDMGYNVFAPDLIAHGKSEGKFISMGGYDSDDLVNWVKKISSENNNADTLLFGISMGAATVMNSLNKDLPSNIKAFIEDSGYVNLKQEFTYQLKKLFNLPSFPVIPAANTVTKLRAGYLFGDVNATDGLKNTKLPALVLHGEDDGFVPVEYGKEAYELINSSKELHTFPGAKHVQAERKYREEYWKIITEFLNKNFGK